jgi:neutral ceramidase
MKNNARAGWAEVDITPPLGLPMGGRGPRYAPGNEVIDPLMAQVLVLEDADNNRVMWLSLDLIGLSFERSSELRYELSAITGIPYSRIILNFAHTHSGPMVNFEKYPGSREEPPELRVYHQELRNKLLRMSLKATSHLQSVNVTLHWGESNIGINRRRELDTGEIALAPNPEGAYNPDLWLMDIQPLNQTQRCMLFSVGCHPVIVYGYAWQGISADYPGACRCALKEQYGDDVHCQFFQGLAGNVRPRILADTEEGIFRKSSADDHVKAGQQLADDITLALATPGESLDIQLACRSGWVAVRRDMNKILPLEAWQEMALSEDELTRNVGRYWSNRIILGPPLAQVSPMKVGVIYLAKSHAIAWISAEAVAEWMPIIKACDPSLIIGVWGYSQFVPTYLPTDALLAQGGYEVVNANMYEVNGPGPFAPGLDGAFSKVFKKLTSGF